MKPKTHMYENKPNLLVTEPNMRGTSTPAKNILKENDMNDITWDESMELGARRT